MKPEYETISGKVRCDMNGKRIFKTLAVTAALVSVLAFSADQALADHGRDGSWRSGAFGRQASPPNQGGTFLRQPGFGGIGNWSPDRRLNRPVVIAPPPVVHRPAVIVAPGRPGWHGPVFVERPVVHRPSWPTIGLNIVIELLR